MLQRQMALASVMLMLPMGAQAQAQERASQQMVDPAQTLTVPDQPQAEDVSVQTADKQTGSEEPKKQKTDLLVVPIPMSNPALGTGLTLAGVLFYNPNHEPRPWVSGLGGGYTSTGTWGGGAFHSMSFGKDAVRVVAFVGYGDARLNFYGIGPSAGDAGVSVDLRDKGFVAMGDAQAHFARHGLLRHLYAGGRIQYLGIKSSVEIPTPNRPDLALPPLELKSDLVTIGPSFTFDSRNAQFAPNRGVYVTGTYMFGAKFLGSDFAHKKLQFAANLYLPVTRTTVIAIRKSACSVTDGAPFYDLCMFGQQGDLRGYETGRYRDGATWAIQSEIRQHLFGKFGIVGFAGIGGVAASAKDVWKHSTVLTSGGFGVRYLASKANNVNLRLDVAFGQSGSAIYFGIGEAF